MTQHRLHALVGAALFLTFYVTPASAETCAPTTAAAEKPAKPKKKGFGLGGILKAAKRAGVGDVLAGGNLLGDSTAARVAGAVAGTAVTASGDSGANVAGAVAGLAGHGRTARIAGAVTGTAAELANSGSPDSNPAADAATACTPAPAEAAAPADANWN
ncbi:hypothetical protein [Altericroceibacterium xinjiangense]|uniref:hypothetical protein n=1 Tax=Altericroceibacterium xinjiangense TaxID=762261 RepID=UPI000F7E7568|nr:hypothetical protein [Altericroceibacterium xinjiangense]